MKDIKFVFKRFFIFIIIIITISNVQYFYISEFIDHRLQRIGLKQSFYGCNARVLQFKKEKEKKKSN